MPRRCFVRIQRAESVVRALSDEEEVYLCRRSVTASEILAYVTNPFVIRCRMTNGRMVRGQ